MKALEWDLVQLVRRNRDGSRATQYACKKIAMSFAEKLHALGARNKPVSNLKQKDFTRVIQAWRKEKLSDSNSRASVRGLGGAEHLVRA